MYKVHQRVTLIIFFTISPLIKLMYLSKFYSKPQVDSNNTKYKQIKYI